ncbi:MAG TPA: hydroxymethylglutaryl-CoA lyase [Acidimicrobiales bacterium]|nr:hydroxymethylglutaryl-CoA lyase [Acidimicrobiales bacterium]
MTAPAVHRRPGWPERVAVWEVGPRDGLQNEPTVVPAAVKADFIARLVAAGLRTVEATSFVNPKWVPQLADAEEVMGLLAPLPGGTAPAAGPGGADGVRYPVLVPNLAGLDRALGCGVRDVAVFASATETFAHRNLNRGLQDVLDMFVPVVHAATAAGVPVRGYLSMCFGDPWEGDVPPAQVVGVAEQLLAMGCHQLSLGDTIGVATTGQVVDLLDRMAAAGIGADLIAVHFHDTYGQALANSLAAVQWGVTTVDASAGGLGGCPFAATATGNLATEDLCWALAGLGIDTGVDLDALVATSRWMAGQLGRPSPSRVVQALGARADREGADREGADR